MARFKSNLVSMCAVMSLSTLHDASAQPPSVDVLRWSAAVANAEALLPAPRAYRLFQAATDVSIDVHLTNESGDVLVIDTSAFQQAVRVAISREDEAATDSRPLPARIFWASAIRWSGESQPVELSPSQDLYVEAGRGLTWRVTIRRADGETFLPGGYLINLDLAAALRSLRQHPARAWTGSAVAATTLHLTIALPATAAEQAAMHRTSAATAIANGRLVDAVGSYILALQTAPDDPELLAGLGNVYVLLNQYSKAIPLYERALRLVRGKRTGIPRLLSFAYVAVGDVSSAERLLRADGVRPDQIGSEVARLREAVRRRR